MTQLKLIIENDDDDFTYVALIDVEYEDVYVSYYKQFAYKMQPIAEDVHFNNINWIQAVLQNVWVDFTNRVQCDFN